jgi:DNA-binding NarL/FixJ family response regulator
LGDEATAQDLRAEAVQLLTECGAERLVEVIQAQQARQADQTGQTRESQKVMSTAQQQPPASTSTDHPQQQPTEQPLEQRVPRVAPAVPAAQQRTALARKNILELEPEEPEFAALSGRELQIAELVSRGHTNRQIARMLSLSHKTVETYLARIFTKLGVSSRAAVATLVGRGVISGGD